MIDSEGRHARAYNFAAIARDSGRAEQIDGTMEHWDGNGKEGRRRMARGTSGGKSAEGQFGASRKRGRSRHGGQTEMDARSTDSPAPT